MITVLRVFHKWKYTTSPRPHQQLMSCIMAAMCESEPSVHQHLTANNGTNVSFNLKKNNKVIWYWALPHGLSDRPVYPYLNIRGVPIVYPYRSNFRTFGILQSSSLLNSNRLFSCVAVEGSLIEFNSCLDSLALMENTRTEL